MNREKVPYIELTTGELFPVVPLPAIAATPLIVAKAREIRSNLGDIVPPDHVQITYHPGDISYPGMTKWLLEKNNFTITSADAANIETNKMLLDKWIHHITDLHDFVQFARTLESTRVAEDINTQGAIFDKHLEEELMYLNSLRAGLVHLIPQKIHDAITMIYDVGWRVMNKSSLKALESDLEAIYSNQDPLSPKVLRIGADAFRESQEGEDLLQFAKKLNISDLIILIEIHAETQTHQESRALVERLQKLHPKLTFGYEFDSGHEQRSVWLHPDESDKTIYQHLEELVESTPYVVATINPAKDVGQTHFDPTDRENVIDFHQVATIVAKAYKKRQQLQTHPYPFGNSFLLELRPTVIGSYSQKRNQPNSLDRIIKAYQSEL